MYSKGGSAIPKKTLKPCAVSGCPNLCEGTYCEEHRKKNNSEYSKFLRTNASKSFYTSKEWRILRSKFLKEHPLCVECLKEGKYITAKILYQVFSYAVKRGVDKAYLLYPLYRKEENEPDMVTLKQAIKSDEDSVESLKIISVYLVRLPFVFEDDIDKVKNNLKQAIEGIFL